MSFEELKRFKVEDDIKFLQEEVIRLRACINDLLGELKDVWIAVNANERNNIHVHKLQIDVNNLMDKRMDRFENDRK